MPKPIAPRRTTKNIQVQDFWSIRQTLSKQPQKPPPAYKQQQFQMRHRYLSHKHQLKQFNPLQHFLTPEPSLATEDGTHTHAYLQSINYRLPEEIMGVKRLMFGLASIIKNLEEIYGVLWGHLDSEDVWKLMQTVLRDTRGEAYRLWIDSGLGMIVDGLGTEFKETRFREIFNTLCIFMQVCYDNICQNQTTLHQFIQTISKHYLNNRNKHLKTFTTRSLSYILSNTSQHLFHSLIRKILQTTPQSQPNQQQPSSSNSTHSRPHICDLMAQRLKYSSGCLTPGSIRELVDLVNWIGGEGGIGDAVVAGFVGKVLGWLGEVGVREDENQSLFDLGYVVKLLLHMGNQNKIKPQCLLQGIALYLQQQIRQKHSKPRTLSPQPLLLTSQYLWQTLPQLAPTKQICYMLALSLSLPLQNIANIKQFLSNLAADSGDLGLVLRFVESLGDGVRGENVMVMIAGFRGLIERFVNGGGDGDEMLGLIVYRLVIMANKCQIKINWDKTFANNINIVQHITTLTQSHKTTPNTPTLYLHTLTLLRLLTATTLNSTPTLTNSLQALHTVVLSPYSQALQKYFSEKDSGNQRSDDIFHAGNYVEELFMYSWEEIPFVGWGVRLMEAFLGVERVIGVEVVDRGAEWYKYWQTILINHPSGLPNMATQTPTLQLKSLQSRHRPIRLQTLQHLLSHPHPPQSPSHQLLTLMHTIDSQDIDLDNERNVKRLLLDMSRLVESHQFDREINSWVLAWGLGFGFTGFRLIGEGFACFYAKLLEVQEEIQFGPLVRFLEFYTFKNSRVYDSQVAQFFGELQQRNLQLPESFVQLVNQDLPSLQFQTLEFIGIERVTLAISKSQKIKKRIQPQLLNILTQYFQKQFPRHKTLLLTNPHPSQPPPLPPKTPFLTHLLKLTPQPYQPPLQCLHYTTDYLKLPSVQKIKRQDWQQLWNRATKLEHSRIKFENMSAKEMELYVHFLWGELLRGDACRLRVVVEYVRDYMNHKVGYFMGVFYEEVVLGQEDQGVIKRIFVNMDSRKLLTYIYILKSIVKSLKNYVRSNPEKILKIIMIALEALQGGGEKGRQENQMQDQMEIEKEREREEIDIGKQDENQQVQQNMIQQQQQQPNQHNNKQQPNPPSQKYRNHRRELYKLLTTTIQTINDQLPQQQIEQILTTLAKQNKISTLAEVCRNSTPGVLLLIEELSRYGRFHGLIERFGVLEQVSMVFGGGAGSGFGAVVVCMRILNNILGIHDDDAMVDTTQPKLQLPQQLSHTLLSNILTYLSSSPKQTPQKQHQFLQILLQLLKPLPTVPTQLQPRLQKYLLLSLTKQVAAKKSTVVGSAKLELLLKLCMQYSGKVENVGFLVEMLGVVPRIGDVQNRRVIVDGLVQGVGRGLGIGAEVVDMVTKLNSTIDTGLTKQLNFQHFFQSTTTYKSHHPALTLLQHKLFISNLLAYLTSPELSVRKAVSSCLQSFLGVMSAQIKEQRDFVAQVFRFLCDELRKPGNQEEQLFWAVFGGVGLFVGWVLRGDKGNCGDYAGLAKYMDNNQQNLFTNLCSISQKHKLTGLKSLKSFLTESPAPTTHPTHPTEPPVPTHSNKYPNLTTTILLPLLQHFILPISTNSSNRYGDTTPGNLTSSLSHVSLEIYELVMRNGGRSLQKKQLKRVIAKLKFDQMHLKRNIVVIKIIGHIIQSIDLPKVTQTINQLIKQQGFQQFHQKLLQKTGKTSQIAEQQDSQSQQQALKRHAFTSTNTQIDDQQLINMGYLTLDKKLIQAESMEEEGWTEGEGAFGRFLRVGVLVPLKTMLMVENRGERKEKEDGDRSRMLLSVVVTKILLKFPVDVFLGELQKIVSKLAKLLKKRQIQIRDHARTCLSQISKLIGPNLFYTILRQLKFHLRDNFQSHILNYTTYHILHNQQPLPNGSLDHCLPLLLPPIIDELYGKSAAEKAMVDQHLIPTINMESKKRKGNDLLGIVCRQISVGRVGYLVGYFEKFMGEFMNSEENVARYEQMLNSVFGGFGKNQGLMAIQNSSKFIEILHESIQKLKGQIKLYKFDDIALKHESTINQQIQKSKKSGKQIMQIQQQAGRNASIFKKQAKQIQQRRNHQILLGCFMQFYLGLLALLLKKKIIDSQQNSQKFQSIVTFIVQCLEHRDNRIVHKCLKVIHNVIHWKKLHNIAQIRKKVSRKIFALIQKLTSADQDLLRQCFTLLNDLFEQVNISKEVLHVLVTIIKLHITSVEKTIAQQPYKLLKTVLIKISQDANLIFDSAVYQLYQYVRSILISTNLDHIRNICRQICSLYLRASAKVIPERSDGKRNSKNQSSIQKIDIKKQISFYLNNLDCKYSQNQFAILQILKTYVIYHSKQELQETGEVIVMSLGTAYVNDGDNQVKISELIRLVVERIDNSKVMGLIDKCIAWAKNQDNQLISVCGIFLLLNLLTNKISLINKNRKQQIQVLCEKMLQKQYNNILVYDEDIKQKQHQIETLKKNPQWKNIFQSQNVYLKVQKNFKNCIRIIQLLLDNYKNLNNSIVEYLWKLTSSPSQLIHQKTGALLMRIFSITSVVGQRVLSLDQSEENSLKSKIVRFLKNLVSLQKLQFACQITRKVLEQVKEGQKIMEVVQNIVFNLLNRISKSVLNLKKSQRSMKMAYDILHVVLSVDENITKNLLKMDKVLAQILWNIAKVNRNELISIQIKQKNDNLSQIIKTHISQPQFYKKLANIQAERKQKRKQQKSELLKLAVTDQQAFGLAKARKKHKKA